MKRILLALLFLTLAVTPVLAEGTLSEPDPADTLCSDGAVLLGGTVEWPEVRGHRFGSSMQQVMLKEESMGAGFVYFDYQGKFTSPKDQLEKSLFDTHFICDELSVLDRPAVIDYCFSGNALSTVRIGFPVEDQAEGNELLKTLADEVTRMYGPEYIAAQGEHKWYIGYGYQFFAAAQEQEEDEGFSGLVQLSCAQVGQGYGDWDKDQWWVNLSVNQRYRINTSDRTASPAYTIW